MVRLDYAFIFFGDLRISTAVISVLFLILGTWGTNTYIGINIKMLAEMDRTYGPPTEPPEIYTTKKTTRPSTRSTVKPPRLKRDAFENISTVSETIAPLESDVVFQSNFAIPADELSALNATVVYNSSFNDSTNEILSITNYSSVAFTTTTTSLPPPVVFAADDGETSTSFTRVNFSTSNDDTNNISVDEIAQLTSIDTGIVSIISKYQHDNLTELEIDEKLDGNANDTRNNGTSARIVSYAELALAATGSLVVGAIFALLFTSAIYGIVSLALSRHELLIGPAIMTAIAGCLCFPLIFIDLNVIDVRESVFGVFYLVAFIGGVIKLAIGISLLYVAYIIYSYYVQVRENLAGVTTPAAIPSPST